MYDAGTIHTSFFTIVDKTAPNEFLMVKSGDGTVPGASCCEWTSGIFANPNSFVMTGTQNDEAWFFALAELWACSAYYLL